jgi:hypothetical protein
MSNLKQGINEKYLQAKIRAVLEIANKTAHYPLYYRLSKTLANYG